MISAGIVVEYNPFHNGHLHHLNETKKRTDADVVIAVMSGNFLQRGEPAIVSKFARTKMALQAGCDIVVELPYAFAVQQAEIFADGAVRILASLGCRYLCFGSESGDINAFLDTFHWLERQKGRFDEILKEKMRLGFSYPKAAALAYSEMEGDRALLDLSQPNNILGYQYLKAIKDRQLDIIPLTIPRIKAGYHDPEFSSDTIASATSIRKAIFSEKGDLETLKRYMPESSFEELLRFKREYGTWQNWENYWPFLKYRIIQSSPGELREIYDMEEGIEYRVREAAFRADSFQSFMEKLKTKRYTWTRLQRLSTHILMNAKKEEMKTYCQKPEYARLLGFSKRGRQYLNRMKEELAIPLIAKASSRDGGAFELDKRAGYIYSFGFPPSVRQRVLEEEYKRPPVMAE
ncbi:nucleotidyltransferase [Caldibacillus debilis]|uniref:nucleotidyltransferase n=1 Tax=Caldibacillus debilis TaxID=301148 RepID=UPI002FD8D37A